MSRMVPHSVEETDRPPAGRPMALLLTLLVLPVTALALLSPSFAPGTARAQQPILLFVLLYVFAGAVYLIFSRFLLKHHLNPRWFLLLFAGGFVLRLAMLPTTPILENDYYRYLWDGAVTARGENPYRYAPRQVEQDPRAPAELKELAAASGEVIGAINHPQFPTIYPPVTQGFFALAARLAPWRLNGWRLLLLAVDLLNFALLLNLLRQVGLPASRVFIYWLNPLLIKEVFNAGHMEILIFPFLLAAFLFLYRGKIIPALLFLALAVGTKIWPILLVPLFVKFGGANKVRIAPALLLFGLVTGLAALPIVLAGHLGQSSFLAYSRSWELNDSLFRLFTWSAEGFLPLLKVHPGHAQRLIRILLALATGFYALWIGLRRRIPHGSILSAALSIATFLFLVSPTQFPWYSLWLLPLLVFTPRFPLLLLTALLPLYYIRYFLEAQGRAVLFDHYLVWLEFVPVWILLIREHLAGRRRFGSSRYPYLRGKAAVKRI